MGAASQRVSSVLAAPVDTQSAVGRRAVGPVGGLALSSRQLRTDMLAIPVPPGAGR